MSLDYHDASRVLQTCSARNLLHLRRHRVMRCISVEIVSHTLTRTKAGNVHRQSLWSNRGQSTSLCFDSSNNAKCSFHHVNPVALPLSRTQRAIMVRSGLINSRFRVKAPSHGTQLVDFLLGSDHLASFFSFALVRVFILFLTTRLATLPVRIYSGIKWACAALHTIFWGFVIQSSCKVHACTCPCRSNDDFYNHQLSSTLPRFTSSRSFSALALVFSLSSLLPSFSKVSPLDEV